MNIKMTRFSKISASTFLDESSLSIRRVNTITTDAAAATIMVMMMMMCKLLYTDSI